jgi:hypothetical protein
VLEKSKHRSKSRLAHFFAFNPTRPCGRSLRRLFIDDAQLDAFALQVFRGNGPPSVAENHQGGSNFRCSTNHFDCASRGALTSWDRAGSIMLTAITAIIIVLSIGILIAHALDAFRSG